MKLKIFVITPVRNVSDEFRQKVNKFIAYTEEKYSVYYPPRDTNQDDHVGLQICCDNLQAIKNADVVMIAWDGKSQGSLFDLGMAFALDKPIFIIKDLMPEPSDGKSFQNMIYALDALSRSRAWNV